MFQENHFKAIIYFKLQAWFGNNSSQSMLESFGWENESILV